MPRKRSSPNQLELFPSRPAPPASPEPPAPRPISPIDSELSQRLESFGPLASRLPDALRFGTSSWSFPGWEGIVYPPGHDEASLARDGLSLYARHPLLRTVGIDRGYYAPLRPGDLERYAMQLPARFPCCAKAPGLYTTPVELGRGRSVRGEPNPWFLDAARFSDEVAAPWLGVFGDHAGPLILEFPPLARAHRIAPDAFVERLDAFLSALPPGLQVAVELRDQRLLTAAYAAMLAARGAAHVYNYWSAMPMPGAQRSIVPVANNPFLIVRLLLRPGTRYEQRREAFAPFDRIVEPDEELRGQVLGLIADVLGLRRSAFVLVNNKAEGSAPLTIEALAERVAAECSHRVEVGFRA